MAGKVDIVMQFPSVMGKSGLTSYKKWIVVDAMEFGGDWQQYARDGTTENRKSGTLALQYIRITRTTDVSTHGLFQSFAQKKAGLTVTINMVSGDGGQDKLFSCVLSDASILHWGRTIGQQGAGYETMVMAAKQLTATGYGYNLQGSQSSNTPVIYSYEELKTL